MRLLSREAVSLKLCCRARVSAKLPVTFSEVVSVTVLPNASVSLSLPVSAPLSPPDDPCAGGGEGSYAATATTWNHPTWVGLGFAPVGTQYYRYAFERTDGGFVARAIGDLDCDGVASTYELRAEKGEDGDFRATPSDVSPGE